MELMEKELDASAEQTKGHPWLTVYQQAARDALSGYLGSSKEQDFDQLTDIISRFKRGDTHIWLKRMGRTPEALWYEKVDFSQVSVLIIEWTHGNSEKYQGVDIPILLNSTPEETRSIGASVTVTAKRTALSPQSYWNWNKKCWSPRLRVQNLLFPKTAASFHTLSTGALWQKTYRDGGVWIISQTISGLC